MNNLNKVTNILNICLMVSMTIFILIISSDANAKANSIVKEQVNTYLDQTSVLNIIKELALDKKLSQGSKLINIKVQAQATQNNAKVELVIDGKKAQGLKINDQLRTINFKVPSQNTLKKIELVSKGAFIRVAEADLVSDQPTDDDLSAKAQ